MKTLRNLLTIGMIGLASLLPNKSEAELNFSLDSNSSSKYMFFGMPFSNGNINQTMLNMNKGDFTGTLWGNYDVKQGKLNEVDVFADYARSINKLNLSLGAIYFIAKVDDDWVDCVDWHAGINASAPLNPSLNYHKFTGADNGDYTELGISKNFTVNKRVMITTSGKIGYNNGAFRDKKGLSHLEGNLKVPIRFSKKLNVAPNINCSKALGEDLKNAIWGGVNVHYNF